MPVVITVLNAYSGFALVAEGKVTPDVSRAEKLTMLDRSNVAKRSVDCGW
jgi:hypothetical protein